MTHLRWLLLRPASDWEQPATRAALLALPSVSRSMTRDGWVLARVLRPPAHPEWFRAIASGTRPTETVLGTLNGPLSPENAVASVAVIGGPGGVVAGRLFSLRVAVTNGGRAPWPVTLPPGAPRTSEVHLAARWLRSGADGSAPSEPRVVRLPRDVSPGETIKLSAILTAPNVPAAYTLELGITQADGPAFGGRTPVRLELTVEPE